ncbi:MAG: ABC transporter ATP-binding protein [Deltaproteobacteria bacterium]|nr:ABC transporter ATP-binding protein [Deltaproteobacteria bacterium]
MSAQPGQLTTTLRHAVSQLPFLPRAFGLVWRAARRWTALWLALLLIQGLLPVATVYLTRAVVDGLIAAAKAGGDWQSLRGPLLCAAIMVALLLAGELLRALARWARTAQSDLVQDHVSDLIHERAAAADLAFYESPDYYDRLHRARADAYDRPTALVESLGSLAQNGITLVAMAAVLIPFGWWIPLALLVSTLPALAVVVRNAQRQHRSRHQHTADERRAWYYDALLTDRDSAAELRLFDLTRHFRSAFQALRSRLRLVRLALIRQEAVGEVSAGLFALAVMGGTMLWMVLRAARGAVTLGDLAMFYQAFNQGQRLMRTLLETVGQIYGNSLFLGNLFEFLSIRPQIADPPQPRPALSTVERAIVFRGVSFRYPGADQDVLRGFDLEVTAGQVVALLGANGSGKTTAFKLLCRFYDPDAGSIELDGCDLRQFKLRDVRRMVSVMFQEPAQFYETVRDNIGFGDLERQPAPAEVEAAARAAGADDLIARLGHGYDTLLGTWLKDGAELSVGEWRRIALARAFLRRAPIVLLDEPTASMDAWATAAWFDRFRELTRGRTAIVITHRLSTARRADTIAVLEGGRIVERGGHSDLVARDGPYARAWRAETGRGDSGQPPS